jgi:hypothetical protein
MYTYREMYKKAGRKAVHKAIRAGRRMYTTSRLYYCIQ